MLKLDSSSSFQNFKCGEIFCISPAVFNVTCLLCPRKMHLEKFTRHFQVHHLTLAEQCIDLEDLDRKRKAKLAKDASLLDNMTIKEEDPEVDPIKQEDFRGKISTPVDEDEEVAEDNDDDDKSLQQLINETGISKDKNEVKNHETIVEQLHMEETPRKPFTRNAKKIRNDCEDKTELKTILQIKESNRKDLETLSDADAVNLSKDDVCDNDNEDDNGNEDNDWADKDENKDTDSSNSETDKNSEDELPYPCLTCKRSYRTKHGLQKHNYRVHNPNKPPQRSREHKPKHKCDECNEVFRSARDLRGHKWKHTGIFCDICGKPFTQTGNMIRHKIRHTGIKAHKCNECSKDFFTAKELKSHMICHTGLMPLICEICGKRCRDRGVLTAHMRRHTGERPAKCHECGKSFFSFHDLNVHAVTHTSERPFKCDICGSTFQRKKALRVHKLIHSKDRKHICKICGKSFAQSGGLNSHMRTHDAAGQRSCTESTSVHIPTVVLENLGNQISTANATSTINEIVATSVVEEVQILGEYVV